MPVRSFIRETATSWLSWRATENRQFMLGGKSIRFGAGEPLDQRKPRPDLELAKDPMQMRLDSTFVQAKLPSDHFI